MKFACPDSQNRVLLKCGNIDSGSAMVSSGAVTGLSAPAAGLLPFGGEFGCRAYAGSMDVAATISHNKASRVLDSQRIGLRFRFLIFALQCNPQNAVSQLRECDSSVRVGAPEFRG